jgi:hypothetical protein
MKRVTVLCAALAILFWVGSAMAIPTTASVMDGVFNLDTEWAGHYKNGDSFIWPGPGGQGYDVEYLGLYITSGEVFFGLQTGYPLYYVSGPGDLALDVDNDGIYDYAIRFSIDGAHSASTAATASIASFTLYDVSEWAYPQYHGAGPYKEETGTFVDTFQGGFGLGDFPDNKDGGTSYVIEGAFDRNLLGPDQGDTMAIHWTMYCGNDYLTETAKAPPVPEPATMLLLGVGLCGLTFVGRKKLFKHA